MSLSRDDKEEVLLRLLFAYRARRRMRERFLVVFDGDYGRLAVGPKKYTRGGIAVEWAIGESATASSSGRCGGAAIRNRSRSSPRTRRSCGTSGTPAPAGCAAATSSPSSSRLWRRGRRSRNRTARRPLRWRNGSPFSARGEPRVGSGSGVDPSRPSVLLCTAHMERLLKPFAGEKAGSNFSTRPFCRKRSSTGR